MSFQAKLLYLIAWILRMPVKRITNTTDLRNDLNLDSTDFELMIFQLENYYHTTFTDEQIRGIETVQDLGHLLRQRDTVGFELAYAS